MIPALKSSPLDPNKAQRAASDPSASVWVAASAGSGKTKILADRVLRLLLSGTEPQKILCLTFTRAAAAEMEIRVTGILARWATCSDDDLRTALDKLQNAPPSSAELASARRLFARVLNCAGGLRIRTIHGFAQELLKRFPIEANLPPHFTLLEEADSRALQQECLDTLLLDAATQPTTEQGRALACLAHARGTKALADILREATKDPAKLRAAFAHYNNDINALGAHLRSRLDLLPDETEEALRESIATPPADQQAALRAAAPLLAAQKTKKGRSEYAHRGDALQTYYALPLAERTAQADDYLALFLTTEGTPNSKLFLKETRETFPDAVAAIDAEALRLMTLAALLETRRLADQNAAILCLAGQALTLYENRKAEAALQDYDDLIAHADALLARPDIAPWILYKLDNGIDHILVDESQDTAPAQWRIIRALADAFFESENTQRTLFVVGDEKQSIYSFQKADPKVFADMHTHFAQKISTARKEGLRDIPLTVSFRSAPAILKAVDAVFAKDQAREGVSHVAIEHHAFRQDASGRVELWPLVRAPKKPKDEEEDDTAPRDYEYETKAERLLAEKIASFIETALRTKRPIRNRTLTPGDIMILVRRRTSFVDFLVRELKTRHIPVTGVDRMHLMEQLPVTDLLALLSFMLLPQDDFNLAVLLRGPLIGFTEEQMIALAALRGNKTLWAALQDATDDAARKTTTYLRAWLAREGRAAPFALLSEILAAPCPADSQSGKRALHKRLGPDALDPIEELLNAAQDFTQRHAPSLQAFLHWLKASDAEIKRELDSSGGQVRITTVHASKGLEAPLVILPDTTTLPAKTKLDKILWDDEDHIPFYIPKESSHPLLRRLRDDLWQRQLEEYRRLFYVALTRASDHLCLCGYETEKPDTSGQNWYALAREALTPLHEPHLLTASDEEGLLLFADPLLPPAFSEPSLQPSAAPPLPAWVTAPAPEEPKPPRPLMPSRPDEEEPALPSPNDSRFARGLLLHRLLQSLPEVAPEDRAHAARRFLEKADISSFQKESWIKEILALLAEPAFTHLFGPNSRAEVSLTGTWKDRLVSGQIDRLCLVEDEVWIVDYKTNRPPPTDATAIPKIYRDQMAAYRGLVAKLYPAHRVRCFLLWTFTAQLMEVACPSAD